MGRSWFGAVRFLCAVALLTGTALGAQQSSVNSIAPIPPALLTAKKVFVSNAGSDHGLFPHPFNGDPDRPYNEFWADLQSLRRYELVTDPAAADLVFELRLNAPNGPSNADKTKGASDPLPMFRLVIYDQKSHYVLWALTESIEPANLQKTHDHNFDVALSTLIEDVKKLTAPAVLPTNP